MIAPFFIVGSARSGTTFLRLTLNAHPEIAVPPESRFITELFEGANDIRAQRFLGELEAHKRFQTWGLPIEAVRAEIGPSQTVPYSDAITATYRAYAKSRGKSSWGDKTPRYIEHIPFLATLFPDARFIHLVRDGRNVAISYAHVDFGPKNVAQAADLWARRVSIGLRDGRALEPSRYIEVRAEDLAVDAEKEVEKVCGWLGLETHPLMFDPAERAKGEVEKRVHNHTPEAAGRSAMSSWETDMRPLDIEIFEAVAGSVLSELGYPRRYPHPGRGARFKAAAALKGAPIGRL